MGCLRSGYLRAGMVILVAILWKITLLAMNAFPFNADEAIVGLMARHILAGEKPIFFYGQAYMGSLDAWLSAAGFALFGSQVWVIRLVQTILYALTILSVILLGRVAFGSWNHGILAGLLLALPAVNTTLYTTVSLGGYGEALLLGTLGLLVGFWMSQAGRKPQYGWWFAWGWLAGVGLWANAISWVFFLPMGVHLLVWWIKHTDQKNWRSNTLILLTGISGGVIGSLPWWIYALQHGFGGLLGELFGGAVAVEGGSWLLRSLNHAVNFFLLGLPAALGLRPPWEVRWLALPLLPLVLGFWIAAGVFLFRRRPKDDPRRSVYKVLGGIIGVLGLLFIFTPFGVDPSGRYFLPLAIPLALGAGGWLLVLKPRYLASILAGMVLAFNLWGTLDCALKNPPGITTQFYEPAQVDQSKMPELVDFLLSVEETRGYSTYWASYPLAFLTDETILFTPRLPYHLDLAYTNRDERYAPYAEAVARAEHVAYISTRNPILDERLRSEFTRLGITWQEKQIGDFCIFYHLSRLVRPDEMNITREQP